MKMYSVLLFGLLTISYQLLYSQKFQVSDITVMGIEQGFDTRDLNPLLQDNTGYMWLCSDQTLYRWDGMYARAYEAVRGDSTTVPTSIQFIRQGKEGMLWIVSDNTICLYNPIHNSFRWIRFPSSASESKKTSGDVAKSIFDLPRFGNAIRGRSIVDSNGNFVFTGRSSLWLINPATYKASEITPDSITLNQLGMGNVATVTPMFCDGRGIIWFRSSYKLLGYNSYSKQWITRLQEQIKAAGLAPYAYVTYIDHKGRICFLSPHAKHPLLHLYRVVNNDTYTIERTRLTLDTSYSIDRVLKVLHDTIWVNYSKNYPKRLGDSAGIGRIFTHDMTGSGLIRVEQFPFPLSTSDFGSPDFLYDKQELLWCHFADMGNYNTRLLTFNMKTFKYTFHENDETGEGIAWKQCELYHSVSGFQTGTWFRWDDGTTHVLSTKRKPFNTLPRLQTSGTSVEGDITSIAELEDGTIVCIASNNSSYRTFNPRTMKQKLYRCSDVFRGKETMTKVFRIVRSGTTAIGCFNGLAPYYSDGDISTWKKFGNQMPSTSYRIDLNKKTPRSRPGTTTRTAAGAAVAARPNPVPPPTPGKILSIADGPLLDADVLASIDERDSHRLCPFGQVNDVSSDRNGNLYFSVDGGIDVFDIKTKKISHIHFLSEMNLEGHVSKMCEDSRGYSMTMAKGNTIIHYDIQKAVVRTYLVRHQDTVLIRGDIEFVRIDAANRCWLGYSSGGLARYNIQTQRVEEYLTTANGLPTNNIRSMEIDRNGNIWIGTTKGLVRYNPDTRSVHAFTTKDGLCGDEFKRASTCTSSGMMWFATTHGVLYFHPDSIRRNNDIPPVVIAGVSNPTDSSYSLYRTTDAAHDRISYHYSANTFTISFAALSYFNASQNQYKYRLEGYDKDWIATDAEHREARYTKVPPGTYTFYVIASNNDGIWNETGSALTIIIETPWWQTLWAYFGYFFFGAVGLLGIRHAESGRQRRKSAQEMIQRENAIIKEKNALLEIERQKSESLLLNILPASIAERLKNGEKNIADRYDAVSILFADIVGFTQYTANLDPERVVHLLNDLFTRFDKLSEQCGVERIKTIGDAYMAVAGAPLPIHDHVLRTTILAFSMLEQVALFSYDNNLKLNVRIGIHCGEVVGAIIGQTKFAYDIWGDAVNTASRMESHGEAGKIHVSEEFARNLIQTLSKGDDSQDIFSFPLGEGRDGVLVERGDIAIKGKGIMKTYFLERSDGNG